MGSMFSIVTDIPVSKCGCTICTGVASITSIDGDTISSLGDSDITWWDNGDCDDDGGFC